MGSDASATDTAHPAGARALERSTSGQPRFPFHAVVDRTCCPVLRGRASGSLFEFLLLVRGALGRGSRAYSSAG